MGISVSIASVQTDDQHPIHRILHKLLEDNRLALSLIPQDLPVTPDIFVISKPEKRAWVSIVFPDEIRHLFWDCAQNLARRLGKPTFSFHVHEGHVWTYDLYDGEGELVDSFNSHPDVWEREGQSDDSELEGRPDVIVSVLGLDGPGEWKDHLVQAKDDSDESEPAVWELAGFMEKLGMIYPDPDTEGDEWLGDKFIIEEEDEEEEGGFDRIPRGHHPPQGF
ncbi:MAG: hypothetical protein RL885_00675 [Planctomycetota bacterium]